VVQHFPIRLNLSSATFADTLVYAGLNSRINSNDIGAARLRHHHWSVVLAAGRSQPRPARAGNTLPRVLVPDLRVRPAQGLWTGGSAGFDAGILCPADCKGPRSPGRSSQGKVPLISDGDARLFSGREWTRAHRQKRGGQFTFVSRDEYPPEERYQLEPADNHTPETNFLRQWALTVLKQAMSALERECQSNGKGPLFQAAKNLISGERDGRLMPRSARG
jgi:hypothetical protein